MKEIPVTEVGPVYIGQTENAEAGTGCTVIVSRDGMSAGLDVRGGGPASRETTLLDPLTAEHKINAVVIAGGSAFGLGAADGVMKCLEERGIGYEVVVTKVPLVVQSDIFDLTVASSSIRPDPAMGYEAARIALDAPNYRDGNFGAGCGATVGKIRGRARCMKSGIGSHAREIGKLKVGAVAAVNALGDIFDPYFNRTWEHYCSHQHTPNRPEPSGFACGVRKGAVAYLAHPVFSLYARKGMVAVRDYAMGVLRQLLGAPTVEVDGLPSTGRVTLQDQPAESRKVLHLVWSPTSKRGGIDDKDVEVVEDLIPLRGISVTVRPGAPVKTVRLVPQGTPLPFETAADGAIRFTIPEILCHQMVELA